MAVSEQAGEQGQYDRLPEDIPAVQQLGAADWHQVLTVAVTKGGYFLDGCWQLPTMQQLDAERVGDLLRACAGHQHASSTVGALLMLPGAQLMPAAMIGDLLQHFLQDMPAEAPKQHNRPEASNWTSLLGLPHAANMPAQTVQQLYAAALETGLVGLAHALLLALPQQAEAVFAVTGQQLVQGIIAAIKRARKGGDLTSWAQEPGLQSLDAGSCVQLVLELLQLAAVIDTGGLPDVGWRVWHQ